MNEKIARYECYRIFSLLFKVPNEQTWQNCTSLKDLHDYLRFLKVPGYERFTVIDSEMQNVNFEDVSVEFAKLFFGPFEVLVPPYGSCYIESTKQVMQESTIKVKDYYNNYGVNVEEGFNDLPDHIVPELEFMYYLLYNEVEHDPEDEISIEQYQDASKDFFKKYLIKFAIELSESIIDKTELKIFKEIAAGFSGFINNEARIIFGKSKNVS